MLNKRFVLENVELVQQNCNHRGVTADVARFASLETDRRALQTEIEEVSRQANLVSKSIGKAKDETEREARKEEGRRLREEKDAKQQDIDRIAAEADSIHRSIPNLTHADAPIGSENYATAQSKFELIISRSSTTLNWPTNMLSSILKEAHESPDTGSTF